MERRRIALIPITLVTMALVAVALAVGLFAPKPADAEESFQAKQETILGVMRQASSGTAWLRAEGLDPRLRTIPGWDALTRLQWRDIGGLPEPGSVLQQAGGALVPFRDPAPAFSRNLLVTRDLSNAPFQTEPHIAVDPKDPKHLVLGVIDYGTPSIATYVSYDGGQRWEGPTQVPYLRDDLGSAGDPVLAFDRNGNVHAIGISIGIDEFTVGRFVYETQISAIALSTSKDGGTNWSKSVSTAKAGVATDLSLDPSGLTRGAISLSFLDKPWMAVGPDPQDSTRDMIYITYTDFTIVAEVLYIGDIPAFGLTDLLTTIKMVRSEDGGLTWSEPISISPTVRRTSSDVPAPGEGVGEGLKRIVQGSYPSVAPDGTAYVAWMDSTNDDSQEGQAEIYIARSDDAGETFTRPIRVSLLREPGFRPTTAFFRYWGSVFPRIATGTLNEVYVVYVGLGDTSPNDDGDVYFTRSLDRGVTWSKPKVLGGDESGRLQFFPAIATDSTGQIHVMWGDMRDDPSGVRYHIYYTKSEDRGDTWGFQLPQSNIRSPDTRVTDFPSNANKGFPSGLFIGDYFAIAATEDEAYMVWADTRLGEFGGPNQKIGFARRSAIPSPEVFLNPAAGPGGQEVTIQGFNFQPNLNVFIQVGGVVMATDRTNQEGRFTSRLFMPVSGEGAQDVIIFDESGNVAPASFFAEFGFGSIQGIQSGLEAEVKELAGKVDSLVGQNVAQLQTDLERVRVLLEQQQNQPSQGGNISGWAIAALVVAGAALVAAAAALVGNMLQLRRRGNQ